jgi:hypothetical protein
VLGFNPETSSVRLLPTSLFSYPETKEVNALSVATSR